MIDAIDFINGGPLRQVTEDADSDHDLGLVVEVWHTTSDGPGPPGYGQRYPYCVLACLPDDVHGGSVLGRWEDRDLAERSAITWQRAIENQAKSRAHCALIIDDVRKLYVERAKKGLP